MPSIPITDGVSLNADAELAPFSSFAKYAQALPQMVAKGENLSRWQVLTLADPAVQSLDTGLSLDQPISLGGDAPELTLGEDLGVHFEIVSGKMFSPDVYGDNIAIPTGQCAVKVGFNAGVSAGTSLPVESVTFGLNASAGISIDSYRCFPSDATAPTILEALRASLAEFVIPFHADDVASVPVGTVVTLGGRGSLKFSASTNLLALSNPLATLTPPSPIPALAVTEGAKIKVGASWEIATEYQVRVQRVDASRVRIGWYRKQSSEFIVTASASAGVSVAAGSEDLFTRIIGAISPDPAASEAELTAAGVNSSQIAAIEAVVKKGVSRKLELAIAAEFGSLKRDDAAFLYEVDLTAIDQSAREAINSALRGDLSGLAEPPKGITEVRSILTHAVSTRFTLKINLLGIFNFVSVTKLALQGTVTWTPSTGELLIVDQATASRIQTASVNFGADEEKLRHVMAESFLITAAYRGSKTAIAPPQLKSSHSFFRLDQKTSADELRRETMALIAVGLNPPVLPAGVTDFGRTAFNLEAAYDNDASLALFLRDDGRPHVVEEYESAGREAIQQLVPSSAIDAFRLRPTVDDALWAQMKDLGPANFRQLFPQEQAPVIAADYLAIRWWADTMNSTGQLIERILRPGAANSEALRKELAEHLRDVAAKAHEQFGSPWGLVAMFLASQRRAIATGSITGPKYVFGSVKALSAGG